MRQQAVATAQAAAADMAAKKSAVAGGGGGHAAMDVGGMQQQQQQPFKLEGGGIEGGGMAAGFMGMPGMPGMLLPHHFAGMTLPPAMAAAAAAMGLGGFAMPFMHAGAPARSLHWPLLAASCAALLLQFASAVCHACCGLYWLPVDCLAGSWLVKVSL
jgi:hypothetical protein